MKHKTLSIIAGAASLCAAGTCTADFLGISLELVSQQQETGVGLSAGFGPSDTYRIYANFSVPTQVTAVFGLSNSGAFFNLCFGSIFNQVTVHGDAQVTPPSAAQLASPAGAGWAVDSYFTIGGLEPEFLPGTLDVISTPMGTGHAWTGGWTAAEDAEFGWFLSPPATPTGTKVLLAQITVSSGSTFQGAWAVQAGGVSYFDWDGLGNGLSYFDFMDGCVPPCPADLDYNLNVGVSDLLILLSEWGPSPGSYSPSCRCSPDLTGDGNVGVADLLQLLAAWGPCPN